MAQPCASRFRWPSPPIRWPRNAASSSASSTSRRISGTRPSTLSAAILVTDDPGQHRGFLQSFAGFPEVLEGNADYVLTLPRGRIDVLDPEAAQAIYHAEPDPTPARFLGFCVTVPDLDAVASRLEAAAISFGRGEERIVVPAEAALGCLIAFEQG